MDIFTAFGLSASAGLNAYIPLLILSLLAKFTDIITLNSPWDSLTSWWVIGLLILLSLVEFFADKVPAVNHVNDAIQTFVRPVAGAIVFAASASVAEVHPVLAMAAGLLVLVVSYCPVNRVCARQTQANRFEATGPTEPVRLDPAEYGGRKKPAVTVTFDLLPTSMRFHLPSFPCMVTENNIRYSNFWAETYEPRIGGGSFEPLFDRRHRYARMWIERQSDARIVVRVRGALCNTRGDIAHSDIPSGSPYGKGDWVDEWFYIYPDGTHMRHVRIYTGLAPMSRPFGFDRVVPAVLEYVAVDVGIAIGRAECAEVVASAYYVVVVVVFVGPYFVVAEDVVACGVVEGDCLGAHGVPVTGFSFGIELLSVLAPGVSIMSGMVDFASLDYYSRDCGIEGSGLARVNRSLHIVAPFLSFKLIGPAPA